MFEVVLYVALIVRHMQMLTCMRLYTRSANVYMVLSE